MRSVTRGQLPLAMERLYHSYSFDGFEAKGAFAYDSIPEWRALTDHATSELREMVRHLRPSWPELAALEEDMIGTLDVNWRDRGYGVLFTTEAELACRNAAQASVLRPELARFGDRLTSQIEAMDGETLAEMYRTAPLRCDKAKGAPSWSPGSDRSVAIIIHRLTMEASTAHDISGLLRELIGGSIAECQTSYIRTQATKSMQKMIAVIMGVLTIIGERRGPKIRRVAGQPFSLNHLWAPVGHIYRALMKVDGFICSDIPTVLELSRRYRYKLAIDLKSYDTTVAEETNTALFETIILPTLQALVEKGVVSKTRARLLADIDRVFQSTECLLPPRNDKEIAWLARTAGMIRSGENLTSFKGSVINHCRIRAKSKALGIRDHQMRWCVWGDDTILFSNDKRVLEAWEHDLAFAGFREEVSPGPSYLMRYLPNGFNFVCRMVLSTINRESGRESANVVEAAAAIATRMALLEGHPGANYFLRALTGPGASPRLLMAVRIAQTADALTLNSIASHLASTQSASSGSWDAWTQLWAEAANSGPERLRLGFREAIATIERAAHRQQRILSFCELEQAARRIPLAVARAEYRKRSFTRR